MTSPRLIVGVIVPSRSFAAAFSATGVVVSRALLHTGCLVGNEYLDLLCKLPIGARIGYAEGDETVAAVVQGCVWDGKDRYFRLDVGSGRNETQNRLPVTALSRVRDVFCTVAATTETTANLDSRGRFISGWCQHLLAGRQRSEFILASGIQCVILGNLTQLREEIEATSFNVEGPDGKATQGTLQDVLAVTGFGGPQRTARVKVLASSGSSGDSTIEVPVVIFDGASGYLRWRDAWQDSNWMVILDRSDSQFELAVDQLSRDFVQRRMHDTTFKGLPPLPPGVEVLVYQERRR
jgi:hypothetical protein